MFKNWFKKKKEKPSDDELRLRIEQKLKTYHENEPARKLFGDDALTEDGKVDIDKARNNTYKIIQETDQKIDWDSEEILQLQSELLENDYNEELSDLHEISDDIEVIDEHDSIIITDLPKEKT